MEKSIDEQAIIALTAELEYNHKISIVHKPIKTNLYDLNTYIVVNQAHPLNGLHVSKRSNNDSSVEYFITNARGALKTKNVSKSSIVNLYDELDIIYNKTDMFKRAEIARVESLSEYINSVWRAITAHNAYE